MLKSNTEEYYIKLLEDRHVTYLEWNEQREATGPGGNNLDAHIIIRATVHDCINLQRRVAKFNNLPTMGNDMQFLDEFMNVNWVRVIDKKEE